MESHKKTIIYQVLPRLFGNQNSTRKEWGTAKENGVGKLNDFDARILKKIKDMGVTHIWYTGVIRHATQTDYSKSGIPRQDRNVVKGVAGSPYAIADYYDIDPDLATDVDKRMEEFEQLVERTHKVGMKVVVDFVPNHVARQYRSIAKPEGVKDLGEDDNVNMHFSTENNFYYCWGQTMQRGSYVESPAKATGNDQFTANPGQNDWYETVKLNYGIDYCDAGGRSEHFDPIPNTWNKMTDILLFWAAKGVDAFRCDMAEMVPAAFWSWATDKVKFRYPELLFIGEVYDPSQYRTYIGAGFDYLYDKVGMYDCIRDVICGQRRAADITAQWQATNDIAAHMLYFLENHDEQRIASEFFAGDAKKGIPGLVVSAMLNKNPFMLYAGQEFGERGMDKEGFSGTDGRTTIFDYWSLDTLRKGYYGNEKGEGKSEKLPAAAAALARTYKKVLNVALKSRAVAEGKMFDLMYVNPQLGSRIYAFLRRTEGELLLLVTNFSDEDVAVDVLIPAHAFEYMNIPEGKAEAEDLLGTSKLKTELKADKPVKVKLKPWSGRVYKFDI